MTIDFRNKGLGDGAERLLQTWHRRRSGPRCPSRADLNPQDFAELLPSVYLTDVADWPCQFRFRMLGASVARILGGDYLGSCIRDVGHRAACDLVLSCCKEALDTREPAERARVRLHVRGRSGACSCLALPLASGGSRIDQILGTMTFVPAGNGFDG